jgi:hypothetical protein
VPESSISDLTDRALEEAVARECLSLPPFETEGFAPTKDARDAERVWRWLDDAQRARHERIDQTMSVETWKRALCEAALMVARKGKG